jgi:hypothetical protein
MDFVVGLRHRKRIHVKSQGDDRPLPANERCDQSRLAVRHPGEPVRISSGSMRFGNGGRDPFLRLGAKHLGRHHSLWANGDLPTCRFQTGCHEGSGAVFQEAEFRMSVQHSPDSYDIVDRRGFFDFIGKGHALPSRQ